MNANTIDSIIDQALQQPERERARIAERLISSLEQTTDFDVELAWQKEIGKRLEEIDSGAVECVPWEDVRNKLYENANAQDWCPSWLLEKQNNLLALEEIDLLSVVEQLFN